MNEKDSDVGEKAEELAGMLKLEIARIEHDLGAKGFGLGENLIERVHVATESSDVNPIWINRIKIVWIKCIKVSASATTGKDGTLAVWCEKYDGITSLKTIKVSDVARIDTLIVEGIDDSLASWIVGDTAHEDRFVTIAGEGSSGISCAAASAELYFIDIDFCAELNLVEVAALVGAKIVMVDKIDVL